MEALLMWSTRESQSRVKETMSEGHLVADTTGLHPEGHFTMMCAITAEDVVTGRREMMGRANECREGDWSNKCYRCGGRGHLRRECKAR